MARRQRRDNPIHAWRDTRTAIGRVSARACVLLLAACGPSDEGARPTAAELCGELDARGRR